MEVIVVAGAIIVVLAAIAGVFLLTDRVEKNK